MQLMIRSRAAAALGALLLSFACSAQQTDSRLNEFRYDQHPESLERVIIAQENASNHNKQLLVVLAAEWCGDSIALGEQLSEPRLYDALQSKYEIVTADTGYLETGFEIAEYFGLATYYGTPTVLIISPATGEVVNRLDFQQWTNAADKKASDFWDYFINQDFISVQSLSISPDVLATVSNYEQQQAARIRAGYHVAGELLREYKASGQPPNDEVLAVWKELGSFRNAVPKAVGDALQNNDATSLPSFPQSFSWE